MGALGDVRKGFDTLFEAWRRLVGDPGWDARLVVVGTGTSLPSWRARAVDEGLGGSIAFLGFRDDVPDVLAACDLLVSPTRYEAYGLNVQEALCTGLPAIVSAGAGIAERYPEACSATCSCPIPTTPPIWPRDCSAGGPIPMALGRRSKS